MQHLASQATIMQCRVVLMPVTVSLAQTAAQMLQVHKNRTAACMAKELQEIKPFHTEVLLPAPKTFLWRKANPLSALFKGTSR